MNKGEQKKMLVDEVQEVRFLIAQVKEMEDPTCMVPGNLMVGRQSALGELKRRIEEKTRALNEMVLNVAGGVFVTGPGTDKFVEIAEDEEFAALTLDASELYTYIAKRWFPTVRVDKCFELDCIDGFVGAVYEVLFPLGVATIKAPDFGKHLGRRVFDLADAVTITRDIMREAVLDDLNFMYLQTQLTGKLVAGEEEWGMNYIPVVIRGATDDEVANLTPKLFGGRNVSFLAPENVEKNDVVLAFRAWKKMMAPVAAKNARPNSNN